MVKTRGRLYIRVTCFLLLAFGVCLIAQTGKFSATSEYQAILAGLSEKNIKPSRFGSGDLLRKSQSPVAVAATDIPQGLDLETSLWRLEINKRAGSLALTNKQTGTTWQTAFFSSRRSRRKA